ncbi:MAG: peptidoglycan synthetase [Cyclobacteriaceae bacterium]|nr:peptidoglycan synthetase [Cyclobacteriaceae bacterium]
MGTNHHIHFIAIGGSAMHNLAIALSGQGFHITGSDDDIFEPSGTRLAVHGLLPAQMGWFPERITPDTRAVILGMHARADNPELKAAMKMGIRIYSFPEYIYEIKKTATRVVIAGSHGKTTITSMIAYALLDFGRDFDYLIGAGVSGFENMVKISDAPLMILEGDEYLSSSLDRTPKFIRYNHQAGLLSGIAWDHINAFPTKEIYIRQFGEFIKNTPDQGVLVYNGEDAAVTQLIEKNSGKFQVIPYYTPPYEVRNEIYYYRYGSESIPLKIFGQHNMLNLAGAIAILEGLGYKTAESLAALKTFSGAANRLEKVYDRKGLIIYRDFAHSPSKLKSTVRAINEMYPRRKIINCFELHTYSSLNRNFISEYKQTLTEDNLNIVFLNDHTLQIKKMEYLEDEVIREGFDHEDLIIIRTAGDLMLFLSEQIERNTILLLMSSGNFGDLDQNQLISELEKQL